MDLPFDRDLSIGVSAPLMTAENFHATIGLVDRLGYDVFWAGDHVEAASPMLEPLVQLAQAAALSQRLTIATGIYLLPLRHPVSVAKQVASLDRLTDGRLLFGVGVGGEFPNEFAACEVPMTERGARLSEAIPILRALWSDQPAAHQGRFYNFPEVHLTPGPARPGGPPIWCGGRSDAALRRAGRLADGWLAYVVSPERYAESLEKILAAAAEVGRETTRYGTGIMLYCRIEDDYETALEVMTEDLSARYKMDFRSPAKRYGAIGRPEDVAEVIAGFRAVGVRHVSLDMSGPDADRQAQLTRFAEEVRPLL
jgi:probable F420-dependent oxidoreductase